MIQQMANQMLKNNPLFQRAMQMAQGKSEDELKQIANNLCKQRGINIDEAYKQFEQQFSGMMGKQNNHGINRQGLYK